MLLGKLINHMFTELDFIWFNKYSRNTSKIVSVAKDMYTKILPKMNYFLPWNIYKWKLTSKIRWHVCDHQVINLIVRLKADNLNAQGNYNSANERYHRELNFRLKKENELTFAQVAKMQAKFKTIIQ